MTTFVLFAYRGILTRATRLTGYKALNPLHLSAWICPRVQPNPNYYNSPVAYINLICKRLTQLLKAPYGSVTDVADNPSRFLFLQTIHLYTFPPPS